MAKPKLFKRLKTVNYLSKTNKRATFALSKDKKQHY